VAKNKTVTQARSANAKAAESALPGQRAAAGLALRTIFLNLFRHNSARLNSAKYESGWRFTITICWREGEPIPCPAAIGHVIEGRGGHQVEIEFSVSVIDATLVTRTRVDDAALRDNLPSVPLRRGYAKELRALFEKHFRLSYPKAEEEPLG
jgi:hypothetical protein